jgi:polyhydroxyalkanoate synthesis regulator phasin
MLDGVRRFVLERFDRVSSRRPEDLARSVAQQGKAKREQATRIAGDVVDWSRKNLELVTDVVQREVRRQIARLGVATKEETRALQKRVRDLEAGGAAKKTPARKTVAKRTAKTPTAKASTKKKTAARPAAGESTQKASSKKTTSRESGAKNTTARKSARPAKPG